MVELSFVKLQPAHAEFLPERLQMMQDMLHMGKDLSGRRRVVGRVPKGRRCADLRFFNLSGTCAKGQHQPERFCDLPLAF